MKGPSRAVDLHELLAHADWVGAVARRLVDGAALAEDVVQDTWVEALHRPPRARQNLRGWLARVAANRARQTGRAESRRRRRERDAARPEAQPSIADLAERAAVQRDVVGHVLALDEPFRSVVLLRFFEDLTPPQIAERLQVPLKTVHSRLQRAFERLRAKLDREHGDRATWCLGLSPLLQGPAVARAVASVSSLATVGVLIVKTKLGIALAAALIGTGIWWTVDGGQDSLARGLQPQRAVSVAELDRPSPVDMASTERGADREGPEGVDVPADPLPVKSTQEAAPALALVRGRAVDMQGAPLVGVSIALVGRLEHSLALSGPGGAFELSILMDEQREMKEWGLGPCLCVADDVWVTVRKSCVGDADQGLEHIVVGARSTELDGRVQDMDGALIEGARVSLSSQGEAFFGFPYPLDLTSLIPLRTRTDEQGSFRFDRFPRADGFHLYVSAPGFVATGVVLDDAQWPLVIGLDRVGETGEVFLEGVVVDELGALVEDAQVCLGDSRATTGADGLFRVAVGYVAASTPLCAAKKGALPALIPNFGEVIDAQAGHPRPVELILGGAPLEIHGRVIDSSAAACAGWFVSIGDPTVISQGRIPVASAEGLARGIEQTAKTDRDGYFKLEGLFPRDYEIQAFERKTLFRTRAVIAGGDLHAVLRASREVRDEVRGATIDRRGAPVAGVQVCVSMRTFESPLGSSFISGAKAVTDERGEFRFKDVPAGSVFLGYSGERILPGDYEFPTEAAPERHEIEVIRRCHFRIELPGASATTVVQFHDADGKGLQVNRFEAGGMSGFPWAKLESGQSELLSVSELAITAVVMDAGVEVSRHPLVLDPKEVNVLRL
ncbi:MAG: RNA polymerase sigma-70 factor (ECF subfamily) [Chlamydiales bacterium]|jgi:RNA polymerase sigma-70 factor (ECF subfamily)